MEITDATTAEQPAVESVTAAAFDEPADGRVVQMIRSLDSTGATRTRLIALDGDGVVGYVHLSRCWIDTREALVDAMTLTPLAVAPARHGQGIGTALLAAAVRRADQLGSPVVVLEGDWNYYGPRGFTTAEDAGLLRPSERIPRPAFQAALLSSYHPSMIGRVIYPEALWANDCVGLRDPRLSSIEDTLR